MRIDKMSEVVWFDWNDEVFARADAEHKPVLLAIRVAWCSSCAEMDRTSYSEPSIIKLISERFIPIRVDADRRPDINERYHLGGWPTTIFLTPNGEILSGGTFLGVDRLLILLQQVADTFALRRSTIDEQAKAAKTLREADRERTAHLSVESPDSSAEGWLRSLIVDEFDVDHGGFGTQPKLPYPDALTLAMEQCQVSGDERLQTSVITTLDAMGTGGMYDDVDGGFFRYCRARDWTLPSSEKTLESNAALLRVYLKAWETFEYTRYRAKAIDLLRYVHGTFADPMSGGFFASQRADEHYYTLESLDERRAVTAPTVDQSLYSDGNASMVTAYAHGSQVLDDNSLLDFAIKSLERIVLETYERGGGIGHHADGMTCVRGLLVDQVDVSSALLDIYSLTEREVYFDMAQELMSYSLRTMWDDQVGGFFDRVSTEQADIGLLREPLKPFSANCRAASVLSRLALLTENSEFLERARRTLSSQTEVYRAHGLMGATYGLAARAVL